MTTAIENVKASHILVETEAKAAELKTAIEAGDTTFADAAKENSKCPSGANGGDLGFFGRGQMVKEFETVCFDDTVEVGAVSPPIQTQFGYHLIQITDRV